jgi:hypothetical protein
MNQAGMFLLFVWLPAGAASVAYVLMSRPSRRGWNSCRFCGYPNYGEYSYLCPECGKSQPHPWFPKPFMTEEARGALWLSTIVLGVALAAHGFALKRALVGKRAPNLTWGIVAPIALCCVSMSFALFATHSARGEGSSIRMWPGVLVGAGWVAVALMLIELLVIG